MPFSLRKKDEKVLERSSQMKSIVVSPHSVFVGNVYVQHAGAEYLHNPNLCYHFYLVPKGIKVPNAIESSYDSSTANKK